MNSTAKAEIEKRLLEEKIEREREKMEAAFREQALRAMIEKRDLQAEIERVRRECAEEAMKATMEKKHTEERRPARGPK
jgi:hypothetical protein